MQDFVQDRDLRRERILDLGSNKFIVRQTDPYGYWHIAYERGPVPESLAGSYTTFEYAEKAIGVYLQSKNKEIKEVKK